MLNYFIYFSIVVSSVIIMEIVAILTHKYIMHGPGWFLHKSHHSKHKDKFELNDVYFLIFSSPSIICIVLGVFKSSPILLSVGIGILIYGLIYVLLHDILVHRRFSIKIPISNTYLKKIQISHLKHHSVRNKDGASNFGFIYFK